MEKMGLGFRASPYIIWYIVYTLYIMYGFTIHYMNFNLEVYELGDSEGSSASPKPETSSGGISLDALKVVVMAISPC